MLQAITAFLNFLISIFKLKFVQDWLKKDKAGEVIRRTAEMYDVMHEVVNNHPEHGVHRFLIMAAHNGGENMKIFSPQYASCRHEVVQPPVDSTKAKYQSIPLDNAAIQVLKGLYINGTMEFMVKDLPDNSIMKTLYLADGIIFVRVYFIKQTKKELIFASIATAKEDTKLDHPDVMAASQLAIAKIKRLMS